MRSGDYAAAWAISDAVLAGRDRSKRDDPTQPYHLRWVWDGAPIAGRHVLVRCYHGLGDTVQFARFLPLLRQRAASLTLEVQPELHALFQQLGCIDHLVAFDVAHPLKPAECDIEIMELAHVLRAGAAEIAAPPPYLHAPHTGEHFDDSWQEAIGLCWRAGDWNPCRSIALPALSEACAASGRPFVSLQRGTAARQAIGPHFLNPQDEDGSVERTARCIAHLHEVVTVDTMVAHLAGALGKTCLLLLHTQPDWRWPQADDEAADCSVWYPHTRIFHEHPQLGWSDALARLRSSL